MVKTGSSLMQHPLYLVVSPRSDNLIPPNPHHLKIAGWLSVTSDHAKLMAGLALPKNRWTSISLSKLLLELISLSLTGEAFLPPSSLGCLDHKYRHQVIQLSRRFVLMRQQRLPPQCFSPHRLFLKQSPLHYGLAIALIL